MFVLCFCVLRVDAYIDSVTPAIRRLKIDTFGHDLVVFHEHDIRKRKGAFAQMNEGARASFLDRLTEVIAAADITIIAVVIDKHAHKMRYTNPYHPYHLAMQFGLERLYDFLHLHRQVDAQTFVVFEARGAKEDVALELEFRRVCDDAKRKRALPSLNIAIADKRTNSEGLQLADLTARPIGLHALRPEQPNRAWDVIKTKLFRGARNCVAGNGLKVFP